MYPPLKPFETPAAWEASALRADTSWIVRLTDAHRAELTDALDHFKDAMRARGLTAQWLHGNMTPRPEVFPLPTLAPLLRQARADLEEKYGLVVLKGFPVAHRPLKDLHLLHAGIAGHVGNPRPQTVFGEMVQDIRDGGQAPLIERRGSKHNRALSFHNDPSDVISFLCIHSALSGGTGLFASSVAIHNALLESAPEHVETLYQDFLHTYQDYLYVRTGANDDLIPHERYYAMPIFTAERGQFACKYSRFYIDQAQQLPEVPRLTPRQQAALDAWEEQLHNEKWRLSIQYEPGDLLFANNFVCLHGRTAFSDDDLNGERRRHLLRIWLSMPNSRPLSAHWSRQLFFRDTRAGTVRGGLPLPAIAYG